MTWENANVESFNHWTVHCFEVVRCPSYFVRSHLFIESTNNLYIGSWFICQTSIDDCLRRRRRIHIMNRISYTIHWCATNPYLGVLFCEYLSSQFYHWILNMLAFLNVAHLHHSVVSLLLLNMGGVVVYRFFYHFIWCLMSAINRKKIHGIHGLSLCLRIFSMNCKYNWIFHWTKRICRCH